MAGRNIKAPHQKAKSNLKTTRYKYQHASLELGMLYSKHTNQGGIIPE
ncbi:hypothetical protein PPEP_a2167 [Pseudoalteromonas peptidolytica F12-50-A1]|uniref:Uncharacterized protein n=1 Tax=Pseudoalteromonas peptidolytica F12-50-A1 TaxID=1315280 RepID=A0A8I0MXE7_9GAMM|nr:hypothetical protein [Pseudoalteromonas peptidolytica F12-50-A1]